MSKTGILVSDKFDVLNRIVGGKSQMKIWAIVCTKDLQCGYGGRLSQLLMGIAASQ